MLKIELECRKCGKKDVAQIADGFRAPSMDGAFEAVEVTSAWKCGTCGELTHFTDYLKPERAINHDEDWHGDMYCSPCVRWPYSYLDRFEDYENTRL